MSNEDVVDETSVQEFVPDTQPMIAVENTVDGMDSNNVRDRVKELRDRIDNDYRELCHLLWCVNKKEWFRNWNYGSFKEYVSIEVEFKITKALYLIQIYELLYYRQSNKSVFEKVMSVGWSKAKELVHVANHENVDEWVNKAQSMNVETLNKEVKRYLKSLIPDDPQEAGKRAEEISDNISGTGAEASTKHVSFSFSAQDHITVGKAIDMVKETSNGITNGGALACIAQDFIGSNNFDEEGKDFAVGFLKKYESIFGLRIVVFDDEEREILYGSDYLAEITSRENSDGED